MPTLRPHQRIGALHLSSGTGRMLADEQRVGKTAAAIEACDQVWAKRVLVVTKASARANWGFEFRIWGLPRNIQVIYTGATKVDPNANVVVVGWGMVFQPKLLNQLLKLDWDVMILDESHEAKNHEAKRTLAVYGGGSLSRKSRHVWPLSGTPVPGTPIDLFPVLKELRASALAADEAKGWPDVSTYERFLERYCDVKYRLADRRKPHIWHATTVDKQPWAFEAIEKKGWPNVENYRDFLDRYGVVGTGLITKNGREFYKRFKPLANVIATATNGKNELELKARVGDFWLRRTQQDVGITKPIFSMYMVDSLAKHPVIAAIAGLKAGVDDAEYGLSDSTTLAEMRRLTGEVKARAVAADVAELLKSGELDCIVLMAWHTNVVDILRAELADFGVCGIDGRTSPTKRQHERDMFHTGRARVFVGNIVAAGEAIDLSASAELWFVEPDFTPKNMAQAALRITHFEQKRQPIVRVCSIPGSVDEAVCSILAKKAQSIKLILE